MTAPTAVGWCPICEATVPAEWATLGGYEVGPLHVHGGSLHGVQPIGGEAAPPAPIVRERVIRDGGRYRTLEPGEDDWQVINQGLTDAITWRLSTTTPGDAP